MTDEEMIHCTDPVRQVERAVAIMRRLRAPGGCPWDAEQDHASLLPNMVEECYECIDAIRDHDIPHMREELGDVLLQVLFHAELASEKGYFGLPEIAQELSDKLVRRHPHVFAQSEANDSDAVLLQWDAIKRVEQSIEDKPYLANCGKGLPALMRAKKLSAKAAKVGFDWENPLDVSNKVAEELNEVRECLQEESLDRDHLEEELGDLLFSVVNLARKCKCDPELLLLRANAKFEDRFGKMESRLKAADITLPAATLDQMEAAWQASKSQ